MRNPVQIAIVAVLLGAAPLSSVFAAQTTNQVAEEAQAQALNGWHEKLRQMGPPAEGCFHASYPSVIWEKVTCGPRPTYRSSRIARPVQTSPVARSANVGSVESQIIGNGTDYTAQASGTIKSATGSFPTVTGVTSEKGVNVMFGGQMSNGTIGSNQYTLQLNTDINPSSTACTKLGYSSCQVWEQFLYSTDAYTDGTHPMTWIQSWVYPSQSDYDSYGCPTSAGWTDATDSSGPACVNNSNGYAVPQLSIAKLASMKLAGAVSANGSDTVTLTVGKDVYSNKVSDKTVYAALWWKGTEFTLVGNGGGSQASFNKGSSIKMNLAINDGSTKAPKCLGPKGQGYTGETNNLTLGACTAAGGTSPSISFTASN
ncbi:hypothetical protein [Dyella silvatica]|uniref:hypothetical protein n=1 Tax=Dyella silvatica TaxID=2992128 RepID=UPI00224EF3B2|nr:hypothetical protein [Dyella silvatica]